MIVNLRFKEYQLHDDKDLDPAVSHTKSLQKKPRARNKRRVSRKTNSI